MDARIGIIYEDAHLLVCRKHAGIAVQTAALAQADMVSELKNHLAQAGGGEPYVAVIHRLDQPVEGLLVFAKTAQAAAALSAQAAGDAQNGMQKEYTAQIYGHMSAEKGELRDVLCKDSRSNTSRVAAPGEKGGKKARLAYEVLEENGEVQTLRIRLYTGRHHQIRVQLSHAGCPILGDVKYGTEAAKQYARSAGITQLCLKADHLCFTHPQTGKKMEFWL
ncbi:MAG: RluA family pseudouridine synthase [Lachnospiraceae bacterium]|nr:RluA family pseudouridine synthase [Lachnospiraceae bacterium]